MPLKGGTFRTAADARRAKDQGRINENRAATYANIVLGSLGWKIERRKAKGRRDEGDLSGLIGWAVEVKSSVTRITARLREAETSAANAGVGHHWFMVMRQETAAGVAISTDNWPVVTRFYAMLGIVKELEEAKRRIRRYEQHYGMLPEDRVHYDAT